MLTLLAATATSAQFGPSHRLASGQVRLELKVKQSRRKVALKVDHEP
jgi:hypothetical protein